MSENDSAGISEYRNVFGVRLQHPCDMPDDILLYIIDTVKKLLANVKDWQTEGDAVVQQVKENLDATYKPFWHVIIGKHFGSHVIHEARHYCFFYVADKAVLIYKMG